MCVLRKEETGCGCLRMPNLTWQGRERREEREKRKGMETGEKIGRRGKERGMAQSHSLDPLEEDEADRSECAPKMFPFELHSNVQSLPSA